MSTASRAIITALILCSSAACGDSRDPSPAPRGLRENSAGGARGQESPVNSASRGTRGRSPSAPPADRVLLEDPPPAAPIVVTEREERPSEGVLTARDYSAELREILGDPSVCLTFADREFGRNIAFQVEVDVQSTGRVVDARVSSPDVSSEAVACLTDAALEARFEAFTDGTRHVQTPVVLRLRASERDPRLHASE